MLILSLTPVLYAHILVNDKGQTAWGSVVSPEVLEEVEKKGLPWDCNSDIQCKIQMQIWFICCGKGDCQEVKDANILRRYGRFNKVIDVKVIYDDGYEEEFIGVLDDALRQSKNGKTYVCIEDDCDMDGCWSGKLKCLYKPDINM